MNTIYLDCEYTNFFSIDPKKTGELLQVAAIAVIDGGYGGSFNEYCKPLTKVWNKEAEKVHKISQERAKLFQHPRDLAQLLIEWIESLGDHYFQIKAFNGKGDEKFIIRLMSNYKYLDRFYQKTRTEWVDVLDKAKARKDYLATKNLKLETLAKHFSISYDAHNALGDVEATIRVDLALDGVELPKKHVQASTLELTEQEKVKKYMSSKYVQIGARGIFITEWAMEDKEAMQVLLSELFNRYVE